MTTRTCSKLKIIAFILLNCIIITILAIFGIAVFVAFIIFASARFFGFALTTYGGVAAIIANNTFLQGLIMLFGVHASVVAEVATCILGFLELLIFLAIMCFVLNVKEIVQKSKRLFKPKTKRS